MNCMVIPFSQVDPNIGLSNTPPSAGVVYASISDYVTWDVNLHLPKTTDRYIMTVNTPHSAGEAHLTLVNASFVAAGKDIGCSQNTTLAFTLSSALSTSQMTQMTVDLGVISSTGITICQLRLISNFQKYVFNKN